MFNLLKSILPFKPDGRKVGTSRARHVATLGLVSDAFVYEGKLYTRHDPQYVKLLRAFCKYNLCGIYDGANSYYHLLNDDRTRDRNYHWNQCEFLMSDFNKEEGTDRYSARVVYEMDLRIPLKPGDTFWAKDDNGVSFQSKVLKATPVHYFLNDMMRYEGWFDIQAVVEKTLDKDENK